MTKYTFHIIPNAHLDPVWLWDWHEGMNEGLITCRTVLDLMDENPKLTFIRGESSIYRHVENADPQTFARIKRYVKSGRWEVVGGTVVQPDTNLPAAETLARHYLHGQRYFREKFGHTARVAWQPDSFGHSAGLPEILVEAGIESFAFTRPTPAVLPLPMPAFWWEGPSGARVLAYRPSVGWYGTARRETAERLDETLAEAGTHGLRNIACFCGLGNHGGGPTRAMLQQISHWQQAHPEVTVIFSGLHRFFDSLRREIRSRDDGLVPIRRGELNYTLSGCYSSVSKFKFPYRKTESLLGRAEATDALISARLNERPANLYEAWDAVLFNAFHDILPGSSIERAYADQLAWLGAAYHQASTVELQALNRLSMRLDTRVGTPKGDMPSSVAVLVWNPHPWPLRRLVEVEACLDYRFIDKYYNNGASLPVQVLGPDRTPLPFQIVENEHASARKHVWRKRAAVRVTVPPLGWSVLGMGWVENPKLAQPWKSLIRVRKPGELTNGIWRVTAKVGNAGIHLFRNGCRMFKSKGIHAVVYEDRYGSWGDMDENPAGMRLRKIRETWKVAKIVILEVGPLRAKLWLRLAGRRSWMDLTISVDDGRDAVDVAARVLWNERSSRLKLVMPGADHAEYDVPGAYIKRRVDCEVPGGRWVRVSANNLTFGFASNALYNFDVSDGEFRATVARASRYAADERMGPRDEPWRPAVDAGELTFNFIIASGKADLPRLAAELEQPPIVLLVPPKSGDLPRSGSIASIKPDSLQVLALKGSADGRGFVLRCRETTGCSCQASVDWMSQRIPLGMVRGHAIATWRLDHSAAGWRARRTNIVE